MSTGSRVEPPPATAGGPRCPTAFWMLSTDGTTSATATSKASLTVPGRTGRSGTGSKGRAQRRVHEGHRPHEARRQERQ